MSSPITFSRFENVLRISAPWIFEHSKPLKVGACISGGPDSMALAHLLHNVTTTTEQTGKKRKLFDVHGLVVDHSVRSGSDSEAKCVAQRLLGLGIPSTIQKLHWNAEELAKRSDDGYEFIMRKKRFSAIVQAGNPLGISHYFLGHHKDDQIETLMMQFANHTTMPRLLNFKGISMSSPMPESSRNLDSCVLTTLNDDYIPKHLDTILGNRVAATESLDSVGCFVHRPLLHFTKQQLLDFCKASNIDFMVDETNKDPKFSLRNAVRALRKDHKLPRALSADRLLALHDSAILDRKKHLTSAFRLLDTMIRIQVFSHIGVVKLDLDTSIQVESHEFVSGIAYLLARVVELVSPVEPSHLPYRYGPRKVASFLKQLGDAMRLGKKDPVKIFASYETIIEARFRPGLSLFVYRQPMTNARLAQQTLTLAQPHQSSEWVLWDRRFCIKVHTDSIQLSGGDELGIRPARYDEIQKLFATESISPDGRYQDERLNTLAGIVPKVMWKNIPVVVLNGEIVEFPTLGISPQVLNSEPRRCSTEVRIRRSIRSKQLLGFDDVPDEWTGG